MDLVMVIRCENKVNTSESGSYSENWNSLKWPFVLSNVLHSSFVDFAWHVSLDSWLKAEESPLGDFSQSGMKSRTLGQLVNDFVAQEQGLVLVIRTGSRIRCSSYLAQYCRCCWTPTRLQLPLLGYSQKPKVTASVFNPHYRETVTWLLLPCLVTITSAWAGESDTLCQVRFLYQSNE